MPTITSTSSQTSRFRFRALVTKSYAFMADNLNSLSIGEAKAAYLDKLSASAYLDKLSVSAYLDKLSASAYSDELSTDTGIDTIETNAAKVTTSADSSDLGNTDIGLEYAVGPDATKVTTGNNSLGNTDRGLEYILHVELEKNPRFAAKKSFILISSQAPSISTRIAD